MTAIYLGGKNMHAGPTNFADSTGRDLRADSIRAAQGLEVRSMASRQLFGRTLFRYGLALGTVVVATVLGFLAAAWELHESIFTFFILAVALTSWYAGVWPAIVAFGLGGLAFNYYFTPPLYQLAWTREDFAYFSVFALLSGLLIWFGIVRRRVEADLRKSREELEIRVAERTTELRSSNEQLRLEIAFRERAEATLRERATLLDLTHDTVFVRDLQDTITYWNRGAEELYGWSKEEALGKRTHDLMQTTFPLPLDEITAELHRTGRWNGELTHRKRDGTQAIVSSRWSLQRNQQGEPIGVLETNNDITERVRAEQSLRAAEQIARGQVDALMQTLDVLATSPAPDKFIGQMLATIGRHLNARGVRLWLRTPPQDRLVLRLALEGDQQIAEDSAHPLLKDPLAWKRIPLFREMLFTGGPAVCLDAAQDVRLGKELRRYLIDRGSRKFLVIPVLIAGDVRGFIGIQHGDQDPYRPEQIELAQALAHQVMLALQLTHLAEQGRHAAVLEERTRMARDIHDTLAQGFTGVVLQMEAAEEALTDDEPEAAARHIRRARQLARDSLGEARRSVHALRPQALEKEGFWRALRSTIRNTTVGTSLRSGFELIGEPRELSPEVEENLLHIGQEALTNTLKHANATRFDTHLFFEPHNVRLEFHDDGRGFVGESANGGIGLMGMKERAEQIDGSITITSSHGEGTRIIAIAPYHSPTTS